MDSRRELNACSHDGLRPPKRKHTDKLLLGHVRKVLMVSALFALAFDGLQSSCHVCSSESLEDDLVHCALPLFVHPTTSPEAWRPVLEWADRDMGNRPLWEARCRE
eukprot:3346233-Amphidinium_carterae.1